MASRPRRSAATKASESISVHAKWADAGERNDRSPMGARRSGRMSGAGSRDLPSSPDDLQSSVTVKTSRSRQPTRATNRRSDRFDDSAAAGTRKRGGRKNYVVDSSPEDDDDDDEEPDLDDDDEGEEDAEGDDMDIDAEGEEDAEGDIDMDTPRGSPRNTIRVSNGGSRSAARAAASKMAAEAAEEEEDDDDDELSDPADSEEGDPMGFGEEAMHEEDAEGEEIEVAGDDEEEEEEEDEEEEEEGEEEGEEEEVEEEVEEEEMEEEEDVEEDGGEVAELDSEGDLTREGTPDFAKMTKRQRARFEEPQEYMKLSDEVQAKKVFTAEELSMRRQEMARRRRNLSEKRNEEVKMETINKLLKKQAPKINRKAAAAARGGSPGAEDSDKPEPAYIRWVNNKDGSKVSISQEIMNGPIGTVFGPPSGAMKKMVEEVA